MGLMDVVNEVNVVNKKIEIKWMKLKKKKK